MSRRRAADVVCHVHASASLMRGRVGGSVALPYSRLRRVDSAKSTRPTGAVQVPDSAVYVPNGAVCCCGYEMG